MGYNFCEIILFYGDNFKMELIERINYLANKAKNEGLTEEEKKEQQTLRQKYLENFRNNMRNVLDNVYIKDENGNEEKLKKK